MHPTVCQFVQHIHNHHKLVLNVGESTINALKVFASLTSDNLYKAPYEKA